MQRVPRPLLVFHDDRVLLERLRAVAMAQRLDFRRISGWEELFDEVRSAPASALIVVDPYADSEEKGRLSIELASLLNRFPSLTVTAALELRPGRMEDLLKLG